MDIKGENEAANNQSAICWLFAAHRQFLAIASSGRKATTTPLRAEINEKEKHILHFILQPITNWCALLMVFCVTQTLLLLLYYGSTLLLRLINEEPFISFCFDKTKCAARFRMALNDRELSLIPPTNFWVLIQHCGMSNHQLILAVYGTCIKISRVLFSMTKRKKKFGQPQLKRLISEIL